MENKKFPSNVIDLINFYESQLKDTDIVLIGEAHGIEYINRAVYEIVSSLIKSNNIEIYISESVVSEDMPFVKKYFKGELNEEELFKILKKRTNWFKNFYVRKLLKEIKNLKKNGNKIKFCGIDVDTGRADRKNTFVKNFNKLDKRLQREVMNISGKNINDLSDDGMLYDREGLLAQNIFNCLEDNKKTLIRVGRNHALSLTWKDPIDSTWLPTSSYLKLLTPSKTQISTYLFHPTLDVQSPEDRFVQKYVEAEYKIYSSMEFDKDMRFLLKQEDSGIDMKYHSIMDFWIFGPQSPEEIED